MTNDEYIALFDACYDLKDNNPTIAKTLDNLRLCVQLEPNFIKTYQMSSLLANYTDLKHKLETLTTIVEYHTHTLSNPSNAFTLNNFVDNKVQLALQITEYSTTHHKSLSDFIDYRISHSNITGTFNTIKFQDVVKQIADDVVERNIEYGYINK